MKNHKIALIDADLIDKGTLFPNLALMKISSYYKKYNYIEMLYNYNISSYDKVFVSKVFTNTKCPYTIENHPKIVKIGGTGFYFDKSPKLSSDIENIMPDYNLYNLDKIKNIKKKFNKQYYTDFSIGFLTRGCFRKCNFCVNRNYNNVEKASNLNDFLDINKKHICLLDDNFFGYKDWKKELDNLIKTKKYFQFKQGLDIRLLTKEKINLLLSAKYFGDYIFAFDNYNEKEIIENKLKLWINKWKFKNHRTKLYVLCAYKSIEINDLIETFERIKILFKYKCYPYIMKFKNYKKSEFESIYTSLAGWCNQPHLLSKMSFEEYCVLKGMGNNYKKYRNDWDGYVNDGYNKYKSWREFERLFKKYPILNQYKNLRFH